MSSLKRFFSHLTWLKNEKKNRRYNESVPGRKVFGQMTGEGFLPKMAFIGRLRSRGVLFFRLQAPLFVVLFFSSTCNGTVSYSTERSERE